MHTRVLVLGVDYMIIEKRTAFVRQSDAFVANDFIAQFLSSISSRNSDHVILEVEVWIFTLFSQHRPGWYLVFLL